MKELVIAFGLFLFIEGILYALFPSKMKNMLKKLDVIKENNSDINESSVISDIDISDDDFINYKNSNKININNKE
jgi:hypothetical protein